MRRRGRELPVVKVTVRRVVPALLAAVAMAALGASAASARTTTVGLGGWQVQSSAQATQAGAQISAPGFATGSWLHVRPDDGGAVGTEVNALVQTGHCPNVFFSTNMKDCFGYMDSVGPETIPQFSVPWWFRTDFRSDWPRGQHATADRQRRRWRGRRLGQRPRGRDPRHGPGRLHPLHVRRHAGCCTTAPTRSRSRCTRTTRARCSRSTTSTGRRSRRTTTPASSSRSSSTPRARWR